MCVRMRVNVCMCVYANKDAEGHTQVSRAQKTPVRPRRDTRLQDRASFAQELLIASFPKLELAQFF